MLSKIKITLFICFILVLTSCTIKDYTCNCTVIENDANNLDTYSYAHSVYGTKSDARSECPRYSRESTNGRKKETRCTVF